MATGKSKTIDEIDDIGEMFQAMVALDISCKGLKTLDEMKDRLRYELHQSTKKPSWSAGEAFSILSEAKDEDATKRHILLNLYSNTENCLKKMDDKILNLLEQSVVNIKEKMNNHKLELLHREYFLLVAGETGSGKSSLVNLILGEELLPYSLLSTTSTICELKFGDERKIVAHFKDKDPVTGLPRKEILLQKPSTGTTRAQQSYLQQISPFVHVKSEREKGSPYKRIELFWPHSLLEKGIVIIDSPGIGESEIMDEIVRQYLPEAFAFIYVVNSANAGGVQKDRLEKLLEEVRKLSLEGQGQLSSKCALFVCNKWDQVPEKEVKDVKKHVIRNLRRCWPGLDPESQIIYMSSMNAAKAQDLGIITEEFSSLMNCMRTMILKSIQARLEIHWRWLDYLLSRIIYQAKVFVKNASRDRQKIREKMKLVIGRLLIIETQQSNVMAELNKYLKSRVDGALQKLTDHLSSEQVKDRFSSWNLDEVPNAERSWEATENQIMKALSRRLREIIEQWEEDNQVFAHTRESLLNHFQQRYQFVEEQLRDLQSVVTDDNIDVPQNSPLEEGFSLREKVIIGVTSPLWVPLTLVALVIGTPIVGIIAIKEKLEENRKIKKYEADKCAFMAKISAEYLNTALNEVMLRTYVKEQLAEAKLCLKQIEARIPELIQADRMLCEQLIHDTRSQKEIEEQYEPIMNEASELRGHLALFGFKYVCGNEIKSEELDWIEDGSHRLGCGAFGAVYEGMMTRKGATRPVALKVSHEALNAQNASEVMAEVELLRELKHAHIVEFYGTSLLKTLASTRVILVMKKCQGNLKSRIFKNPECIPGKSGDRAVILQACRWMIQITGALAYIHKKGVVHRDLKLENVLLSDSNSVKITDVGVSKAAVDITGTLAGTPVYFAPEVIRTERYNCQADIYSLGIIMWEMWYGQQAFAEVTVPSLEAFFLMVSRGYRPKHVECCKQPPDHWKRLMYNCWNGNPQKRPTATKCLEEMTMLSAEISGQHVK